MVRRVDMAASLSPQWETQKTDQLGTRLIATQECAAHAGYKKALIDADDMGAGVVNLGRFQLRAVIPRWPSES